MVADTYSPHCGAIEQGTGNNNNSWGTNLNGALTALDLGIAGYATHAVTGGNLALDTPIPPAGQHPAVEMVQNFTGVLVSNQTVTMPNVSKIWMVENACTGAFTLKFKTTAGAASVAIPQNGQCLVICDGFDNMFVGLSTSLRDVQWLGADGTIALPGVSFATEPALGLRRVSAGVMALTVGGVDIITVSGTAVTIAAAASFSITPPGSEMNYCGINEPTGWYFQFGQTKTRAADTPLMNAISQAFTATTNNTVTLTSVSVDLRNLGLEGAVLEGTGMFTGATIVSVDSATQITMSNAATNAVAGGAVRAFPYGNGDGSITFTLPDARGEVAAGRDNMGGSTRGKLTNAGSGLIGTKLNAEGGSQSITLSLGQIPSGITSSGSNVITVSPTGFNIPKAVAAAVGQQPSPSTGGNNVPTTTGTWGNLGATDLNTTNSIAVTSNNTGGSTTPVVQPTRIRNVLIKR